MRDLSQQKIAIASDHAGFELKESIIDNFTALGVEFKDLGAFSGASVDYPDYGHPLAAAVESGEFEFGIAICGSGNGINMTVNKHQTVRGALCWTAEIARLARQHNNANILTLPARFISVEEAFLIVEDFFRTDFEGGRHCDRVDKIRITN